ncbi:glycosyltransferase family 2 protein [Cobetia sp. 5-25-4-2]|uniref:glycosyltransferase family 2 protein n=1 Tax=Cobetia sp. 5-25-4-2 TaxID=2737459 RepID=UPI0015965995|nr:glycosyltransferase [Cobetia sp. 5-25-4-2]
MTPVIVFVYNRLDCTIKTIEALKQNDKVQDTDLYVFSDGPRQEKDIQKVEEVRDYINNVSGFNSINLFYSKINKGLGASVINGVNYVLQKHDTVIVLEDDIVVSRGFIDFMNKSLDKYKHNHKVYSISGYRPPVTTNTTNEVEFVPRISSWGWAIWKDRWQKNDWSIPGYDVFIRDKHQKKQFARAGSDMLDMLVNQVEGTANAWAIRCDYNRFLQHDSLTLYPPISLVNNIGNDGLGVNTPKTDKFNTSVVHTSDFIYSEDVKESISLTKNFHSFYPRSIKSRIIILLRRIGIYNILKRVWK